MWNAGLAASKAGIRLLGEIWIASDMQMIPHYGRNWRGTKEPLDEDERGEWKTWLETQTIKKLRLWHLFLSLHANINRRGKSGSNNIFYFLGLQNHCGWWLQPGNVKTPASWKKSYNQPRQHIKKQRHYFADKGLYIQSYGLSSSHIWMWDLDHRESWAPKMLLNCGVGEKILESPLNCKEIKPVNPKGNQSWIFIGRTVAQAEALASWWAELIFRKEPDARKDERQEETVTTRGWW